MRWIARAHIHVDKVVCPWLISRFVDSEAEFIFVASSIVTHHADKIDAILFDVKDAELGHHGNTCSFEAIIEKYILRDLTLLRMARIIYAADIDDEIDTDPAIRRLEAIATGYGSLYQDDLDNLTAQFDV